MFIDSHAHLFFNDYHADFEQMIQRAREAGVTRIVVPGTDLATSKEAIQLAEKYEVIYAAVGYHPHEASKADMKQLEEIERLSEHPRVVAIGEIGLDYHYNYSPPETQKEVFNRQIEIAQRRNLPIIIHSREAEGDTMAITKAQISNHSGWKSRGGRGVFHCFPGDYTMAEEVIRRGFFISIPGPVTFVSKSNKPNSMVEVVAKIPLENILLETDCPYLTPVPHRGKRNEPSYVPIIAKKIAEIRNCSIDDVAGATTKAASQLFGIPL
jgi:TatD DNase family protein